MIISLFYLHVLSIFFFLFMNFKLNVNDQIQSSVAVLITLVCLQPMWIPNVSHMSIRPLTLSFT